MEAAILEERYLYIKGCAGCVAQSLFQEGTKVSIYQVQLFRCVLDARIQSRKEGKKCRKKNKKKDRRGYPRMCSRWGWLNNDDSPPDARINIYDTLLVSFPRPNVSRLPHIFTDTNDALDSLYIYEEEHPLGSYLPQ